MKNLLVYSTLTGNTKKVVEACYSNLGEEWELLDINNDINLEKYEKIVLGTWIDKGTADKKSLDLIKKIEKKKVGFIITLGAYPDSDHAKKCVENINKLFQEKNNEVLSYFICQGAVDPKLIEWMKNLPTEHPHSPNPERIKRWEDASKHPDESDLKNAKEWFENFINN